MLGRSMKFSAGAMALLVSFPAGAAPAPIVDTKSTSTATNVSREQLDNLPAGRRLDDLIRTCPSTTIPTVTRQPQMLVDGVPTSPSVTLECIQPADVEMIEVYKVHNSARAEYGAPPLVWDPFLVLSAGEYVGTLARTGKPVHASREGRGTVRENISQGLPSWSIRQLMGNWTKEKQNFIPGTFPNVSRTGNWYDIGHWAQMIWVQTVLIGCARAAGIGSSWLVCRYDPGGNKDGKQVGIPPLRVAEVEQPPLPNAEVFNRTPVSQPAKTEPKASTGTSSGDEMMGRRASLFDLGIYAGGAWTTDWFDEVDPLHPQLSEPGGFEWPDLVGNLHVDRGWGSELVAAAVHAMPGVATPNEQSDINVRVDTTIEQPTLPTTEVFNQAGGQPNVKPGEPSYQQCTSIRFWDAENIYREAKAKGDVGGMTTAKAWMADIIMGQYQAVEAAVEAGEMAKVPAYGLADFLGKMMESYKELTGELPPGYYEPPNGFELDEGIIKPVDSAVEQPELPTTEVFKPDEQNRPRCDDVM